MKKNYIALLYSFIEKKYTKALIEEYNALGFSGGTITEGNGAATSFLWRMMGFEGPERTVLLNLIDEDMLVSFLENKKIFEKSIHFQSALVPLNKDTVSLVLKKEGIVEENLCVVEVICNKGFALEVMEKARLLGAPGGTILEGRGTAREEDEVFFGNKLVKEKELVLIIAEKDTADKVVKGIEDFLSSKEDGAGIVFTLPVSYFSKTSK